MKKIVYVTVAVILCMMMLFTGCGQSVGSSPDSGDKATTGSEGSPAAAESTTAAPAEAVTLNYYTWSDESTYIPNVTAAFEKANPDIKLNTNVIPSSEYDNKMKVLIAGGTDIDVLDVRSILALSDYANQGALANVSDLIKKDNFDVSPYGPLYQKYEINGVEYGLPYRGSCWMLLYNKDIFDKEGIPYPTQMTWSQFADLSKKLTKGTGTDKQWGSFLTTWIYNQMAIQKGSTVLDDNAVPALKYSLEVYNRLFNVDKSAMGVAEQKATSVDANAIFESGKVAMEINGDWTFSLIDADIKAGKAKLNWDVAPLPVPEDVAAGTSHCNYTFAAICNKSSHQEQAWQYLKFFCGEEGAMTVAQTMNFPAYHSDAIKEAYVKATGKSGASIVFNSKLVQEQPTNAKLSEVMTAFNSQAELYLLGEVSLDKAMETFTSKRAEILK